MANSSLYSTLATSIVKSQSGVLGPIAFDQAKKVSGIDIDETNTIIIKANGKEVLGNLVKQFETIFGLASVESCKDAIKETQLSVSPNDLPEILQ